MTVVDASVWVSVVSEKEPHHQASRRWLAEQSRRDIAIPALALAEIAGAVARRTGVAEDGKVAVRTVLAIPGLRVVSVNAGLGEAAAEIAAVHKLRGADAIYVATAQLRAGSLATLDREIQERAADIVNVVIPG